MYSTIHDPDMRVNRFSGLLFFISTLIGIIRFMVVLTGILAVFGRYIPLESSFLLYLITQLLPVWFLSNILFVIYRSVFIRKIDLLCVCNLIVFLLCGNILFSMNQSGSGSDADLRIMSYNLGGFSIAPIEGYEELQALAGKIKEENPHVIAFQEFRESVDTTLYHLPDLLSEYPYRVSNLEGTQVKTGTVVLSKYPIVQSVKLDFRQRHNNAVICDIAKGNDTLTVVNFHLQTTGLSQRINKLTLPGIGDDMETRDAFSDIFSKYKSNAGIRQDQVREIRSVVADNPYPFVLCGDMNDTPASSTYKIISENLKDAFHEAGVGYTYTYRSFFKLFRIDYFFYSGSIQAEKYASSNFPFSDHNPIFFDIAMR